VTEQTDAIAVVVSEESGAISLVERGRIRRALDEERLRTALLALLKPGGRPALAALGNLPGVDGVGRGLRLRGARSRRVTRRVGDGGAPDAPRRLGDRPADRPVSAAQATATPQPAASSPGEQR
jgi:hypothetical protein